MKAGVLASAVAVLCLAGLASDKAADNAKAYQGELETMKGQAPPKILSKIAEWQFERADAWMAENPTAKDVGKHNLGKVKFSKQEIKDVFGEAGQYKVAIYSKVIGTSQATMGSISDIGMANHKDATIDLKIFAVIRLVFKEDKLINVRTWPKVEGSTMSGGNSWQVR
jgi:hypothetical protein